MEETVAIKKTTGEQNYLREIQFSFKNQRVGANVPLLDSKLVADLFCSMQDESKKKMVAVSLDSRFKILSFDVVSIGFSRVGMNLREYLSTAIVMRADGLILVHNRPLKDPKPNRDDRSFTKKLVEICELLGISLHDHVIVGNDKYFSFAEQGML